jgi:hypothetical protein
MFTKFLALVCKLISQVANKAGKELGLQFRLKDRTHTHLYFVTFVILKL